MYQNLFLIIRIKVLYRLLLVFVSLGTFIGNVGAQEKKDIDMYYIDGYHGGVRAHYRESSFRSALQIMKKNPEWKLSFDLEVETYDYLRSWDPVSFAELSEYLKDTTYNSKIEIVGASYYQPYCWAIGGESNVRHLTYGLNRLREIFPEYKVKSYTLQEPCWTSALPQLLNQFRFRQACLKNCGTIWTGYFAKGVDKDIVLWEGPDGSTIPCIPRYSTENIYLGHTDAVWDTPNFIKKCHEKGIEHVLGYYLQDMGWYSVPRLNAEFNIGPNNINYTERKLQSKVRYVTLNEYVNDILSAPTFKCRFTQEDIVGGLPWGSQIIDNLCGWIRDNENKLPIAEKMATLASVYNDIDYPAREMDEAWHDALLVQHHDSYLAKINSHKWVWRPSALAWNADRIADEKIGRAHV